MCLLIKGGHLLASKDKDPNSTQKIPEIEEVPQSEFTTHLKLPMLQTDNVSPNTRPRNRTWINSSWSYLESKLSKTPKMFLRMLKYCLMFVIMFVPASLIGDHLIPALYEYIFPHLKKKKDLPSPRIYILNNTFHEIFKYQEENEPNKPFFDLEFALIITVGIILFGILHFFLWLFINKRITVFQGSTNKKN